MMQTATDRTRLLAVALGLCVIAPISPAADVAWPARPVRIVVPLAPGGNVDVVARAIAQPLTETFGLQFIVENRPGAGILVGTQYVAKSKGDGYTLLAVGNALAVFPSIMSNPGYDPLTDFTGVTLTCLVPQVLEVNPAFPVRSVKQLIALARSRPGEIAYASSGPGGTGHMATELFSRQAGVKLMHVPYKGNSQAIIDVIGGQVMLMFDQVMTSEPYIKAGKLRALGVSSRTRSPLFPDVPTIDESGVPGFEDITWNGLVAPAGVPREILVRLNQEVGKAVRTPALHKRFIERGVELKASASPDEFTTFIKAEVEKNRKLAQEAGIRLD